MKRNLRKFAELPLSSIRPYGWLERWLKKQRDGLTGHLEVAGYPFKGAGWGVRYRHKDRVPGWWPYEQTGYWVDGMVRCGHLLRDSFLLRKARRVFDFEFRLAGRDGFIGPDFMRKSHFWERWPHAVYFRALMAHHGVTGDRRIPDAIRKHYLSGTSPHTAVRDVCNVEAMLWAYEVTGDRRLFRQAVAAYRGFNVLFPRHDNSVATMLSPKRPHEHGVTYNEVGKLGAIMYVYTGNRKWLAASVNAFKKMEKFSLLVDGAPSSSEELRGKDPLDSHETCDVADWTWGLGWLLMATGEARYADLIERACLNAAPGLAKKDFRAHQYLSCPNQVVADSRSNHNLFMRGAAWMSFRPKPGTECCTGEVNRIMPNYAARMWMRRGDGLAAVLYGPSSVTVQVHGRPVTIIEETGYPFSERVDFTVRTSRPAKFTFAVRIPGWCRAACLLVNDQPVSVAGLPPAFVEIRRTFRDGDRVTLHLPMEVAASRWPRGGVALEHGPLVYSLRVGERWVRDRKDPNQSEKFPAWNLYAQGPWNYALALDPAGAAASAHIIRRPAGGDPWTQDPPPVELLVPARRVRGWGIARSGTTDTERYWSDNRKREVRKIRGRFAFTPQLPAGNRLARKLERKVEYISLVPYGTTHLRMTVFPLARQR